MESSDDRTVRVRLDERKAGVVAYLTIDNVRRLNAMNGARMDEFAVALAQLGGDKRLRAVVLTGAGPKAFIVGADINEMAGLRNAGEAKAFITRLHRCCDAIRGLPFRSLPASRAFALAPVLRSRRRATFASRPRKLHSACPRSSSAFPPLSRLHCCLSWSAGDGRGKSCSLAIRSRPAKRSPGGWSSTSCRRRTSIGRSKPGLGVS